MKPYCFLTLISFLPGLLLIDAQLATAAGSQIYMDDYCNAATGLTSSGKRCIGTDSIQESDYARGYNEGYQKGISDCNSGGGNRTGSSTYTNNQPITNNFGGNNTGTNAQLPSGGAGSCNWLSAVQFAQVINLRSGTRCGTRDSLELDVKNTASSNIKVVVYMEKPNGTWTQEVDGTFDSGMRPNAKRNWYTCSSTGRYKILAMPIAQFLSGKCRYPDYHGN